MNKKELDEKEAAINDRFLKDQSYKAFEYLIDIAAVDLEREDLKNK